MKNIALVGFLALFLAGLFPPDALAQLNNKPFAFKGTPSGGVGMSLGGRQAILNQKITGVTPNTLVRSPITGQLLDVTEGPGKSAIVSFEGNGGTIPSFRGRDFRGGNTDMSVGVFNSFFSPSRRGSSGGGSAYTVTASAVISTWTARVATGGVPVSYSPGNVVDDWTGVAHTLN